MILVLPEASDAFVPILGITMLWPSSLMSSWPATSVSVLTSYAFSNTTSSVPERLLPSNMKVTSTVPFSFDGVKTFSEVTALPFTVTGSPVSLSIRVPASLYVLPGVRPLYFTVSMIVTLLSAREM